ncbi:four helix bundle protein [Flaviaesturariibacter flavus]|nr:four helix bundle protein [Flaviaesturariibacter flavus]
MGKIPWIFLLAKIGSQENGTMYFLDDLEVYQLAQKFSERIWEIVDRWESFPKWRIGSQLTEAADSISSNIAEGYGRYFFKQQILFCLYARGSMMECRNWLLKSKRRRLITIDEYDSLMEELRDIHGKLNGYISKLKRNLRKGK